MSLALIVRRSLGFLIPRSVRRPVVGGVPLKSYGTGSSRLSLFYPTLPKHSSSFTGALALALDDEVDVSEFFHDAHTFEADPVGDAPEGQKFRVVSPYEPTGDQPQAIKELLQRLGEGDEFCILQGITGTGKTFVMSHVIAEWGRPTLILCHNKTLAAQLAREFRMFLPHNKVELFVSYYNHYLPESYVESTGRHIEKRSSVNEEIDALRHRATRALLQRKDVVVVASVSCIFGLGLPKEYLSASRRLTVGECIDDVDSADDFAVRYLEGRLLYSRPDSADEMVRGNYQLLMSRNQDRHILSLWPPDEQYPLRVVLKEQENGGVFVHRIQGTDPTAGILKDRAELLLFPAKHHVTSRDRIEDICVSIEKELSQRVSEFKSLGKIAEAERLQRRVANDLYVLRETGSCPGVENYSRHFTGRAQGEPPDTLMDYLSMSGAGEAGGGDWLLIADESHVTLPQLRAMYRGDRSRKQKLVKHGFRLPSALDNRPLKDEEFWERVPRSVFVSATPSKHELNVAERPPVEMMIRPTFVPDPIIEVRPKTGQLADLVEEIKARAKKRERTLALTLTKLDAEDLSAYLQDQDIPSEYIHSGMKTHDRSLALKKLQSGEIDCLVGINLLREGLDLPEVSLVAILHADVEGFLRSETALLQTVGRAARNQNGKAIFYGDRVTESMRKTIESTQRRRERQITYNAEWGKEAISTKGSTFMSIFDLIRDEVQNEVIVDQVLKGNAVSAPADDVDLPYQVVRKDEVVTEHLPSKPGVYFWKDGEGNTLYIGKAKKLRNRVKSYLSPGAKHSRRVRVMLEKAKTVDFVVTPSDRDALLLENKLIKHHQPPFNVLLKDDQTYPFICASIGDAFPRFYAVPRREVGEKSSRYRYFGPYPQWNEIHAVLGGIEAQYDLRSKSFAARHGDGISKMEYNDLFNKIMDEVFGDRPGLSDTELPALRAQYEEARLLFDSPHNRCRDVVAVAKSEDADGCLVHVVQLRKGLVAGQFSYIVDLPETYKSSQDEDDDSDMATMVETVLERQHYPTGGEASDSAFSFFPDEILIGHKPSRGSELSRVIREARQRVEPSRRGGTKIRKVAASGKRKDSDLRVMAFASDNAEEALLQRAQEQVRGATKSSVDGTAADELAVILDMEKAPSTIECYDISHTQGGTPVGSRVVFVDGKPEPSLYRRFNIKTVEGIDDYASLAEVLERRFQRAWVNGKGGLVDGWDPWAMPDLVVVDGGVGQLGAALKGMAKANVFPFLSAGKSRGSFKEEGDVAMRLKLTTSSERSATVAICSLAKDQEQVYGVESREALNHSPDSPALLLLRSLRDESHRFALHSHRKRRSKKDQE